MAEDTAAYARRKPVKLKEPITRDALRVWDLQNHAYFRQNKMRKFLPSGTFSQWEATGNNQRYGIQDVMRQNRARELVPQEVDQVATQAEVDLFKDFLTILGTYCPDHFSDTVYMESTSYNWVLNRIEETFSLKKQRNWFLTRLSPEI